MGAGVAGVGVDAGACLGPAAIVGVGADVDWDPGFANRSWSWSPDRDS